MTSTEIYVNKIEDRIGDNVKYGYSLKLLTQKKDIYLRVMEIKGWQQRLWENIQ